MTVDRAEAENLMREAIDAVERVIDEGVEPAWLWEENHMALRRALSYLEDVESSFAMDEPPPARSAP